MWAEEREENFEPKIIAFICNWCTYAAADLAGVSRIQYLSNVRIIRVMCSGRVDPSFIVRAFLEGADGVLVSGCWPGDCHYVSGNEEAKRRMDFLEKILPMAGVNPKRFKLQWVSASEGKAWAESVDSMVEQVKEAYAEDKKKLEGLKNIPAATA